MQASTWTKEGKSSEKKQSNKSFISVKKPGKSKPKWALTEKDATNLLSEEKDETSHEKQDLLAFVDTLDFKRYVNDIEVQSMIERIRARIESLEKDIGADEARDREAEERALQRAALVSILHHMMHIIICACVMTRIT